MKTRHILLLASLFLAAPVVRANSGVGWQSSPVLDPNADPHLIDSFGNLLDSTVVFQLGTFKSGFDPITADRNDTAAYQANWKLLSSATAPGGWNTSFELFGNSFSFTPNGAGTGTVQGLAGSETFAAGEQAYIWVQCSNGEWALVTDRSAGTTPDDIWQLPDPSGSPGYQATWVLDTADTAVFGNLNGTYSGTVGGNPGTYNYRLQTEPVATVVPEPGSSLMVLLVGCLARVVRTRKRI